MNKKQLRILDEQLNSNNLTRVPCSLPKSDKSLFRALSLSIYFNQNHEIQIIRILKLCLLSCCYSRVSSPFPACHKKVHFFNKFFNNQEMLDMYFQSPQLNCFVNDNLELASVAFGKQVILFHLKDAYLHQTLITACKNKVKQPPIMIAKRGNQYFCVQKQSTRSVMMFIKQNIIHQLISLEEKDKIQRKHKKSFSDHGQINYVPEEHVQIPYEYPQSCHSHADSHSHQINMITDYYYHYGLTDSRVEKNTINLIPNQRYTGRLKFFDQNGNYGFIVVDHFGCDLFVHFDDLQKTGISRDKLLNIRNSEQMRFEFTCLQYDGKQKKSKKAVDLVAIANEY